MTLPKIIWKSLRQHAFSTWVTAVSIALAGGLLMTVWALRHQAQQTFETVTSGFDAVLGARGSKLQLSLNALFHMDESPGNLPMSAWREMERRPFVELAVPIAVGDSYRGYRVVGTTAEMFEKVEAQPGRKLKVRLPGRVFDPTTREAVVGSLVAERLGLRPGTEFHPEHGVGAEGHEHDEDYVVVGVLEPSNTPADRVIWIPLEGLQKMGGHDPKTANEVSAVLLKFKGGNAQSGFLLDQEINKKGSTMTLAWPIGRVMAQLFDRIGWMDRVLELIAGLVAVVAAGSILASIYNSMNERRREIAIMRALGARRGTIFASITLEAAAIAALGMVLAFVVYAVIMAAGAAVLRAQVGVVVEPWAWHPVFVLAPAVMIGLGGLAGLVPAWKAYRTDVAGNLVPMS